MNIFLLLNYLGWKTKATFPYINSGGCCVFAALVGEELRKKGIDVHVVVGAHNIDRVQQSIEKVREEIPDDYVADHMEWHRRGIHFNHLGLGIETPQGRVLYDANGIIPDKGVLDGTDLYEGRMKLDDAKALADNPDAWNPSFDRNNIPRLTWIVKNELQHLTVEPV